MWKLAIYYVLLRKINRHAHTFGIATSDLASYQQCRNIAGDYSAVLWLSYFFVLWNIP